MPSRRATTPGLRPIAPAASAEPGAAAFEQALIEGLLDAEQFLREGEMRGRVTVVRAAVPDVRAIRQKLGLSQEAFAARYGFAVGTVRNWEQGRRIPEPAARLLLEVIDTAPQAVETALQRVSQRQADAAFTV